MKFIYIYVLSLCSWSAIASAGEIPTMQICALLARGASISSGDLTADEIKLAALDRLAGNHAQFIKGFVDQWLATPFVTGEDIDVRSMLFSNGSVRGTIVRERLSKIVADYRSVYVGPTHWLEISVPTQLWREKPHARSQILENVISVMTSIYSTSLIDRPFRIVVWGQQVYAMPNISNLLIQARHRELIDPVFLNNIDRQRPYL